MKTRKELIQEYKRTPKEMGVYAIRNTVNGRCFVASSRDIRARFNRHRLELKTGGESVKALLHDWQVYGAEAFSFEIVDLLEPLTTEIYDPAEDLKILEAMWLEKMQPFEPEGYNKPIATS